MKALTRHYAAKKARWRCTNCAAAANDGELTAAAHALAWGHETRVVQASEIIFRPAPKPPAKAPSPTRKQET